MNFFDSYEITGTETRSPPQSNLPEQSLNEEVSQVIGQLGRFWGGFRRQSQTVLESARRDLGDVMTKLTTEAPQRPTGGSSTNEDVMLGSQEGSQAGPSSEGDKTPSMSTPYQQDLPTSPSQSLFARLSSSLPPNIVSTVQTHLPDSLRNASQSIDFVQLRTSLSTEFQRIQGVTRLQAEEYVHRSEALLKDAMKEAGEALREAVKVIPPEDVHSFDTVWDGTDVWMLPSSSDVTVTDAKGKGKQVDLGSLVEGNRPVATRAESLLKQLKYDPAVIRADPEAEGGAKELYLSWIETDIDLMGGGFHNKYWTDKITDALNELGDGEALQVTSNTLVPSEMTKETFWTRYFFRVYQVEKEEEKRKALLQGSVDTDDEFSWEDDDEDVTTSALPKNVQSMNDSVSSEHTLSIASKSAKKTSAPSSQAGTSAATSPRLSSEDSYDLVSSGNVSTTGETKVRMKKGQDDDPDSDWE